MTDLAHQASRKGGEIAHWLQDREPADVLEAVRSYARRRPVTFLALCGLAGVRRRPAHPQHRGDPDQPGHQGQRGLPATPAAAQQLRRRAVTARWSSRLPASTGVYGGSVETTDPHRRTPRPYRDVRRPGTGYIGTVPDPSDVSEPMSSPDDRSSRTPSEPTRWRRRPRRATPRPARRCRPTTAAASAPCSADITANISTLLQQEIALAKAEVRQSGTQAGKGIGLFAGAGVAGLLLLVFVSVSAWWGLGQYIGNEWSALVVAAVWAIVAADLVPGRQDAS